jgi:cation transport regulator ChaC
MPSGERIASLPARSRQRSEASSASGRTVDLGAPLWYFAYGSNMSPAIFIERRGMRPSAAGWGWLHGYRLCFDLPVGPGERGVANVVCEDTARTCGVLYRITAEEAERLDRTEGVPGGFYRRVDVTVLAPSDAPIGAFTYQSAHRSPGRKPSPRYMGLLLDGARAHGLPDAYVAFLRSVELAVDERAEHARR